MAYYPDPNLFNKAFGGGVGIGSGLADLVRQRQQRSHLAELAQLAQQGDYSGLGAGLIAQGQVGAGIGALNVPFNREQQRLQREFQNEQFMDNRAFRNQQADFQRQNTLDNRDFRERQLAADQAYKAATLGLNERKVAADEKEASAPNFKDEFALAKDFQSVTQDFRDVRDAYTRIKLSAEKPSAAGDLALIFNYMKMLDPGSTVREGEFATAQNAAGVPTVVQNMWNRLVSGERLAPEQRSDFLGRAGSLYQGQQAQYKQTENEYRRRAQAYGFDQGRVLSNFDQAPMPSDQSVQSQYQSNLPVDQRQDLTPQGRAIDWQEYFK